MKKLLTKSVAGLAWPAKRVGSFLWNVLLGMIACSRYQHMKSEELAYHFFHLLQTYENDLKTYKQAREVVHQMRCLNPLESEFWSATNEMVEISKKSIRRFLFAAGPRFKVGAHENFESIIQTKSKIRELERETGTTPLKVSP